MDKRKRLSKYIRTKDTPEIHWITRGHALETHNNIILIQKCIKEKKKHLEIHQISSGNILEHNTHPGIHQRDKETFENASDKQENLNLNEKIYAFVGANEVGL